MKPLTVTQLKSSNVDFEEFHKTLVRYGKIIANFEGQLTRETYFLYRGHYFTTTKKLGEVEKIGSLGKEFTPLLKTLVESKSNTLNR